MKKTKVIIGMWLFLKELNNRMKNGWKNEF